MLPEQPPMTFEQTTKYFSVSKGQPWPDHGVPPAAASVPFGGASRGVRVSGQGVNEQYGVIGGVVELAPGLVGQGDVPQASAEFGLEGAYAVGS